MLRPYQVRCEVDVRAHWSAGRTRVLVALPTGSGKTVVAQSCLIGALNPLAIVHTRPLLDQTRRRLPDVTVMTVQAAIRLQAGALVAHDVVFEDEAHHFASPAWARLRTRYSPFARIVGCTATPERADGAPLTGLYDAIVAPIGYQALLRDGHLAPCTVVPCDEYRGSPALAYLRHGQRRPGILFAPTIAECNAAVAALTAAGVRAATIDADTSARVRATRVAAFDCGSLDVLCSPMALSEGFDSPRAAVCVLDRECVHVGTYLQTANRVTRPYPGKVARLLDCRGASERHGHPLADREYSLEGTAIGTRTPAPRRVSAVVPRRQHPAVTALDWTARAVDWLGRFFSSVASGGRSL